MCISGAMSHLASVSSREHYTRTSNYQLSTPITNSETFREGRSLWNLRLLGHRNGSRRSLQLAVLPKPSVLNPCLRSSKEGLHWTVVWYSPIVGQRLTDKAPSQKQQQKKTNQKPKQKKQKNINKTKKKFLQLTKVLVSSPMLLTVILPELTVFAPSNTC